MSGKGRIRRIKKVMAFIEHDPRKPPALLPLLPFSNAKGVISGSLIQNQRVIGNHNVCLAGRTRAALDETFLKCGQAE